MDKKLKAKWLNALRSGKYKQGDAQLCDLEGRFCCLGVLALIQGCPADAITGAVTSTLPRGYNAGLSNRDRSKLAAMNDGSWEPKSRTMYEHHTFKKIADHIEANL